MSVILIFAAFVLAGNVVNFTISSIVEDYSEPASLFVFLGLFAIVFVIAWQLAVRVAERFFAPADSDRTNPAPR